MGQILLARRMGKTRIIAETGAGQHGVATATVCALFGLPCTIYMGEVDIERQKPNVFRMKLLGAEVVPVVSGSRTLKDAMNEALRDWVTNVEDTFYIIGTVAGPHPYPLLVRDFQSVIGNETRDQIMQAEGRLPDTLVAAVGGGSNAMGLFHPFLDDAARSRSIGVEAAGHGVDTGKHAASLTGGRPGVLHGNRTYLLQDDDGQIRRRIRSPPASTIPASGRSMPGCTISAGCEYVRRHRQARRWRRSSSAPGSKASSRRWNPAHALAHVMKIAPDLPQGQPDRHEPCGRGDKDIFTVADALGVQI